MTILNCECGNEIFIMEKPKQRLGSASSAVSGMISSGKGARPGICAAEKSPHILSTECRRGFVRQYRIIEQNFATESARDGIKARTELAQVKARARKL